MPANYYCLLIDLDGTIFDFKETERQAILGTLEQAGLSATDADAKLYSEINDSMWKQHEKGQIKKDKLVLQRFNKFLSETGQKGNAFALNKEYANRLSKIAIPFQGAEEALKELAEFATLAAVTNGTYFVQKKRLEVSGFDKYFDDVFVSEKLGCVKPSPRFFDIAINRLGVKNRKKVLVAGDSLTADIKGGMAAKLDTCWCNFAKEEEPEGIRPTYIANNYEQLKLIAVGEEELKNAENREKRHIL